jgi:hypothetical protein
MRTGAVRGALAGLVLLALTGCNIDGGVGYVEIKTVPPSAALALYLDAAKIEPPRNGMAVLRQKVGTIKLQTDLGAADHLALLCNIVVQKNRITSVTVTAVSRQLRCQCGRNSAGTDTSPGRTCIA